MSVPIMDDVPEGAGDIPSKLSLRAVFIIRKSFAQWRKAHSSREMFATLSVMKSPCVSM